MSLSSIATSLHVCIRIWDARVQFPVIASDLFTPFLLCNALLLVVLTDWFVLAALN
jgi:hypothetical protein